MTDFSFPPPENPVPPSLPPTPPASAAFDPNLFPSRHRPLRQWLADHNPCLLLSTLCMLLGCYLVNSALRAQNGDSRLLVLIGVINLYEACIIPLGLLLIRRTRGTARDGWWLLLFETLFLVNATFINPDFSAWWAVPLNAVLFVFACGKAAVILHFLKIGISARTLGFFAVQLGLLYALPIVCHLTERDGVTNPKVLYGLWWVVGLLPVLYDQLARGDGPREWDLVQTVIRRVYVVAPWVMLVAHLRFSHWAHNSPFQAVDGAPILLGLAVASMRAGWQRSTLVRLAPAAALLISVFAPAGGLQFHFGFAGVEQTFLPGHFALAGVILAYGYMASAFYFLCSLAALFIISISYLFQAWILAGLRGLGRFMVWLMPTTALSWGAAVILVAFVLLGVGTLLSLKRTKPQPSPPEGV
jgi:hypothetical protein